jgi:type VI secretion system protein ImpF
MPRLDPNQRLTPSILDRLIAEPDPSGRYLGLSFDLQQMADAVRRDLEELLNTRRSTRAVAEEFPEVRSSVVNYGLPDLSSISADTDSEREDVARIIESVIAGFEPRLRDVRAHLVGGIDGKERALRYHITARLAVDPCPEVGFDTVLELMTGNATVQRSES